MRSLRVLTWVLMLAAVGCGKKQTASFDENDTQVAGSSVSAAINSGDSSSGVAFNLEAPAPKSFFASVRDFIELSLTGNSWASSCPTLAGTSCTGGSSNIMSLVLGGCNPVLSSTSTWTGTITLTYSSSTACSNVNSGGLMSMGANNNVIASYPSGITRTAASGYYVTIDSSSSGYSVTESGGTQVICGTTNCTTSRTVNVLGVHRALYNSGGTKLFDHTLSTPTPFTISGTGASKTVATGGVMKLQHNLSQYVVTATISQTLTHSSGCCFPTGGEVQLTFSAGSKAGSTETIDFTSSCGVVTVNANSVTLGHCF